MANEEVKYISVIGSTGYVGAELVRGFAAHPFFRFRHLTSQTFAGKPYSEIYPEFRGIVDVICEDLPFEEVAKDSDLVITALPHGVSAKIVPDLLKAGAKVIDHSGDFRYKDLATYEKSYKLTHPNPELLAEAVYGIPEFYRDQLKEASLVANPGCYPTCSLIAMAPFLKNHLIDEDSIIIDAVSGVSGAGRKADLAYAFCETDEAFKPYGAVGHRHTTEIAEQCSFLAGKNSGDIKIFADTLDKAVSTWLKNDKAPRKNAGEPDNRTSHFYLAMYWADELSKTKFKGDFESLANDLKANEDKIMSELLGVQGNVADMGGYYMFDENKANAVMRPSATLNKIIG